MSQANCSYTWRCRPLKKSLDDIVLDYLERKPEHPLEEKRDLILKALRAYYAASAYAAIDWEREKTESLARECVFALLRQVDKLCSDFNLDRSQCGGLLPVSRLGEKSHALPEVAEAVAATQAENDLSDWNVGGLANFNQSYEASESV